MKVPSRVVSLSKQGTMKRRKISLSLLLAIATTSIYQADDVTAFVGVSVSSTKQISHNTASTSKIYRSTKATPSQLAFFNFGKPPEESTQKKETPAEQPGQVDADEPDLIEKVFSMFFGKPEETPFGLKRFGKERFPEQYPAVIDEWADPVPSDTAEMAILRPLLKNTNLESRALRVTYNANQQGWSATKFHQAVDKQGGALVVCKTTSGLLCGGYNPKGWVGYGENRGSIAAFLFVQNKNNNNNRNDANYKPFIKLRKVGGAGMAQMDNPECGPCFGADSLVIPLNSYDSNPKLARSKLGSYYERFEDGTNSLFGKNKASVQLSDLKVFHGVYEEGEYVPFTDAEPFALY
jgi:TLD